MGKQFELIIQKPKPKPLGVGVLSVDKRGEAHFFEGLGESNSAVLAHMVRSRLESAAAHGLMISGMEPAGLDKHGCQKFVYQEWWLRYLDSPAG